MPAYHVTSVDHYHVVAERKGITCPEVSEHGSRDSAHAHARRLLATLARSGYRGADVRILPCSTPHGDD